MSGLIKIKQKNEFSHVNLYIVFRQCKWQTIPKTVEIVSFQFGEKTPLQLMLYTMVIVKCVLVNAFKIKNKTK